MTFRDINDLVMNADGGSKTRTFHIFDKSITENTHIDIKNLSGEEFSKLSDHIIHKIVPSIDSDDEVTISYVVDTEEEPPYPHEIKPINIIEFLSILAPNANICIMNDHFNTTDFVRWFDVRLLDGTDDILMLDIAVTPISVRIPLYEIKGEDDE